MNKFLLLLGIAILMLAGCSPAAKPEAPAEQAAAVPGTEPPATENAAPEAEVAQGAWQIVGTSAYTHAVDYAGFMDGSFGITVGYAGEVHYTIDGGTTWPRATNTSMCRFGLEIVNEKVAWHCGNGGHVRLSTDGGQTWQQVANFGPSEPNQCRFLSFLDDTTGWAATPALLGATNDGGQTWTEIALPEGLEMIAAMQLRTAQDGYLLGSNGSLYVTADGGQSWTAQALDFTGDAYLAKNTSPIVAMRFMDETHGIIALPRGNADEGFYVWSAYTEDGGVTWRHDKTPLEKGIPFVYLSRDGLTLTVLNKSHKQITVLQFQP